MLHIPLGGPFSSNAIQYGHRKVTFLLSVFIGLILHWVQRKYLTPSSLVPLKPYHSILHTYTHFGSLVSPKFWQPFPLLGSSCHNTHIGDHFPLKDYTLNSPQWTTTWMIPPHHAPQRTTLNCLGHQMEGIPKTNTYRLTLTCVESPHITSFTMLRLLHEELLNNSHAVIWMFGYNNKEG